MDTSHCSSDLCFRLASKCVHGGGGAAGFEEDMIQIVECEAVRAPFDELCVRERGEGRGEGGEGRGEGGEGGRGGGREERGEEV